MNAHPQAGSPAGYCLYTDGSCLGNPGPGGWAFVLLLEGSIIKEASGGEPITTNNRMELQAALEGLRAVHNFKGMFTIITDSQYLKDGMEKWISRWKRSGWRTAARKPVKNVDLWRALDANVAKCTVRWEWVQGHSGDTMNEHVDTLAREAAERAREDSNL